MNLPLNQARRELVSCVMVVSAILPAAKAQNFAKIPRRKFAIVFGAPMGLNERRKVKELQDAIIPGRMKEIEEICGVPIPYDVDWGSLTDDAGALNFIDNVSCH